jgi:hypothetical protein
MQVAIQSENILRAESGNHLPAPFPLLLVPGDQRDTQPPGHGYIESVNPSKEEGASYLGPQLGQLGVYRHQPGVGPMLDQGYGVVSQPGGSGASSHGTRYLRQHQ